jgi:hypothetical protein
LEHSKGKMRPSLVRASDLRPAEADGKPTGGRAEHGHFAAGNRIGIDARFKNTVRKSLGDKGAQGDAGIVASDSRRVFGPVLRSLPSEAPPVRALLTVYARHQALHGYYTALAERAGLDTAEGLRFLEVADRQSQRAERVLVTCHDLARVHAATAKEGTGLAAVLAEAAAADEPTTQHSAVVPHAREKATP